MNGEKFAQVLAGLAVLAVAVIAAVVSFAHIESLALSNGYSIDTARLLPFSVDGLIVASSLSLVTGGRGGLARLGLVLGVAATIAANVVFGVRFGVTGAVINSWPAVAFIVSSEILVGMVRGSRSTPARDDTAATAADVAGVRQDLVAELHQDVPADVPQGIPAVPLDTPITVPSVPQDGPESVPVPADVPGVAPVACLRPKPATPRSTPKRTPDPARVFAADLRAGHVPSLRSVKERCHVGTDRAREIQSELRARLEVSEAA